jgi:hypothetical protein
MYKPKAAMCKLFSTPQSRLIQRSSLVENALAVGLHVEKKIPAVTA